MNQRATVTNQRPNVAGQQPVYRHPKISRAGKDYYYSRNEAKYNDYVLTEAQGVEASEGNIEADTPMLLDFPDIDGADELRLENPGPNQLHYWCAADDIPPNSSSVGVKVDPAETITKTATELGWETLKPFLYVWSGGLTGEYHVVRL